MTNRRSRIIHQKQKKRKNKFLGLFAALIFILILAAGVFITLRLTAKNWDGKNKFSYVFRLDNGDVDVVVLDPKTFEITSFLIPGDTEVNLSYNLGTLRIKNVSQLGVNEKLPLLLPRTITKNFLFPVFLTTGKDGKSLTGKNIFKLIKFVAVPEKTNISFLDRFSAAAFSLKVNTLDITEIDLAKSQFLERAVLGDGEKGYKIGPLGTRLTSYFSDNDLSINPQNVYILDETGSSPQAALMVGNILEVAGAKVVAVTRQSPKNFGCAITGRDLKIAARIAKIFDCQIKKTGGSLDLQIELGSEFAKNF